MAAIQLAASCGELYFSCCCALKRIGTFASESKEKKEKLCDDVNRVSVL